MIETKSFQKSWRFGRVRVDFHRYVHTYARDRRYVNRLTIVRDSRFLLRAHDA